MGAGLLTATTMPGETGLVIVLSGQADAAHIEDLVTALYGHLPARAASLVVDLAGLSFIDSAALHVLIELARRLRSRGGGLTLRHPRKPVADLLMMWDAAAVMAVEPGDSRPALA